MKKISILILASILACNIVFADVLPYYINSLRRYGIGYTSVTSPTVMRQTPSENGKILESLNFDYTTGETSCIENKTRCTQDEVFAAFSQSKKIALLTTLDETEGWSLVCFNQSQNPVCGWVKEDAKNMDFIYLKIFKKQIKFFTLHH